ncbi:hypothetical protein DUI87_03583 [Hirundo rustica rustica]|uniref:Cyclin-dependent kinases regulatory subunit n=1 Tax=Hirundo rustica rustica TaxID=333673 RepID=A0A3M0L4Z7_HIRRU|nr:hypothetical protein DUI87_03583 [Hirundo rustica rustica]
MAHKQIYYSDKYFDEQYEYRHVMLPRELSKQVPKSHLMSEEEWRRLGVQQSLGWVHYMIHEPVAGSQCQSNNSTHCNGSGIGSESAEQTYPVRQENKSLSKQRRSKEGEKKLDKKKHDGGEASVKIVNRTSFQASTHSRESVKPDRFNKTTNKKSTETAKPESCPVPTFETSFLNFHKSQSLESSEILNEHHKGTPVEESQVTPEHKYVLEDTSTKSKALPKASDEAGDNLYPSSLDGRVSFPEAPADGSAQPHVSWAVILSQPPKKIVSSPESEGLSRGKGKQESEPKQSGTKDIASETEPEEGSEKKKKKKKKKKKLKSRTDIERPQSDSNIVQHHRRLSYCSQVLSKEVDSCVTDLLKELVRFQDRLYQKDPVKAKIKRRLVMGLREVLKHLKLKKLKCVIISPNCEKIQSKGGLDETLHNIIDCACEQNIPFVFALNRKALGRCVNKAVPVSVVGIFSYDGAQDHFHRMVQLTTEARKAYKDMIAALEEEAKAGLRETQPNILTPESEKNGLLETCKTSSKTQMRMYQITLKSGRENLKKNITHMLWSWKKVQLLTWRY